MIEKVKSIIIPFLKRFWWLILIIIVITISIVVIVKITNPKESSEEKTIVEQNVDPIYFSQDFPACPDNLSGLFTEEIIKISQTDHIIPLGMVNASSHTIPTDHLYMMNTHEVDNLEIYAPSDSTIVGGENKITYSSDTGEILRNDYSLNLVICRGLMLNFTHFGKLSDELQAQIDQADITCPTDHYHFGDDMTTYYTPCQYSLNIDVKAGDLLGYPIEIRAERGIDIGLYNYNSTPLNYISQWRYSEENLHTTCPFDLYSEDLRAQYYEKLGSWNTETDSIIQRTIEPRCGWDMYDTPGTAMGNWFVGDQETGSVTSTQYMMALVPDYIDPTQYQLSIKGPEELGTYVNMYITPTHSGTTNRDFSEVTDDGNIYCYYNESNNWGGIMKDGSIKENTTPKYLIQLVDDTHLYIEKQTGDCTTQEVFTTPFTFER